MKFKGEENELIWESFLNKKGTPPNMEEDFEDEFDDGLSDEFGDDEYDMGDDQLDTQPEAQGMVMEIDPVAPVQAMESNKEVSAQLKKLMEFGNRLNGMKDTAQFEDWMVSAITIAATYVSDVCFRLDDGADFANTGFEQADNFQQF